MASHRRVDRLDRASSDATVIGCQDKTYTADTTGTNELCSADDGTASVTVQLKMRVDETPPEATAGTPARAADVNGWYNGPVGIAFSGTDVTSGIDTCIATTYSGPDSGAASIAGTCRDKAGTLPGATIDLAHPPMFRWVAVKRARYYNFQLYLNGRKRLTAWTVRPQFQLRRTWTFAGKRQRLVPGHYRWIVWPGFGPRSRADYGKAIGRSDFVVKR